MTAERKSAAERQGELCLVQLAQRMLADSPSASPDALCRGFRSLVPQSDPVTRARFYRVLSEDPRFASFFSPTLRFRAVRAEPEPPDGRIALVRNPYNEEAYRRFSHIVGAAHSYYSPSFADACEDVFDNRCSYCILPIGNTEDGRLMSFYALLERYELRLCAVTELEVDSDAGTLRYALAGRRLPNRIPKHAVWYLEGSITHELDRFPAELPQLAPVFDASLIALDSLPVPYRDGLQRLFFSFRASPRDAVALDLFLSKEYSRYEGLGFYPNIDSSHYRKDML